MCGFQAIIANGTRSTVKYLRLMENATFLQLENYGIKCGQGVISNPRSSR